MFNLRFGMSSGKFLHVDGPGMDGFGMSTGHFCMLAGPVTIFHFQFSLPGTGRGGISSTKVVLLLSYYCTTAVLKLYYCTTTVLPLYYYCTTVLRLY